MSLKRTYAFGVSLCFGALGSSVTISLIEAARPAIPWISEGMMSLVARPFATHLQGLVCLKRQNGVVGTRLAHHRDTLCGCALDVADRLGLTFCLADLLFLLSFRSKDDRLLLGVGARGSCACFSPSATSDGALLLALGQQNGLAASHARPSSASPWRSGCRAGGSDVLQLHAVDLDAPRVGRLVEDGTHLGVDGVAGHERLCRGRARR